MLIDMRNVCKVFIDREQARRVIALKDVDLTIGQQEFVCIIGPSGCGKSTLLNLLAGFEQPTSGKVLFKGRPIAKPGPDRALVFQEATLYPWLTATGNVEFGLKAQGYDGPTTRRMAREYIELVGLEHFAKSRPFELSGGMRQRVALARALALNPDVLLMDEPFGALDAQTRENLQKELLKIWRQRRTAVVFITHNVEEAVYLGQRVIVLTKLPGRIRADITLHLPDIADRFGDGLCNAKRIVLAELAGTNGDGLGKRYELAPCACMSQQSDSEDAAASEAISRASGQSQSSNS